MTETATKEMLGELLLREGRLQEGSLSRALEAQRLVGGRLGTNLLELGVLGEGPLIEAIGRQRRTCTAGRAELARISPAVLRSVPEKLARRYRLVPYEVRGKTLFVASCDPGDLLWEDEITFLTSFMVRTCVALELHVMLALRQHYRIPVDRRFLALAKRMRAGNSAPAASPGTATPGRKSSSAAVSRRTAGPSPMDTSSAGNAASERNPSERASTGAPVGRESRRLPTPRHSQASTQEAPSVEFIELDPGDLARLRGPGASQPEAGAPGATALNVEEAPAPSTFAPATAPPAAADDLDDSVNLEPAVEEEGFSFFSDDDPETRLAKAALALQEADIRDEIGDVLLAMSGAYFARRMLLIARRGRIVGWRGAGDGLDEERIRELDLDEKAPSIFAGLRDAESFWLGPLPPLPANRQLVEVLGGPAPKNCLALPVVLRSKVVAHLYADNLEAGVSGAPLADMKRLAAKAGLAFEVYILKNKIRML